MQIFVHMDLKQWFCEWLIRPVIIYRKNAHQAIAHPSWNRRLMRVEKTLFSLLAELNGCGMPKQRPASNFNETALNCNGTMIQAYPQNSPFKDLFWWYRLRPSFVVAHPNEFLSYQATRLKRRGLKWPSQVTGNWGLILEKKPEKWLLQLRLAAGAKIAHYWPQWGSEEEYYLH